MSVSPVWDGWLRILAKATDEALLARLRRCHPKSNVRWAIEAEARKRGLL